MDTSAVAATLASYALALPGAWEDHPWGTRCAKVGKKIFCGLGGDDPDGAYRLSLKLTDSLGHALTLPVAETSPGWGKHGWVGLHLHLGEVPVELLLEWVEESYRNVAGKRLVAELDARP